MRKVLIAVLAVGLVGVCWGVFADVRDDPISLDSKLRQYVLVDHKDECRLVRAYARRSSLNSNARTEVTPAMGVYRCTGIDDEVRIWLLDSEFDALSRMSTKRPI